jgi:alpha-L-fucosidase
VPKALVIQYELAGKPGKVTRAEEEQVKLGDHGTLKILSASFGPVSNGSIPRSFPSGPIVREHAEFAMATSDVRFTQGKDGAVYAFIMATPKPGETLRIRALGRDAGLLEKPLKAVSLLGAKEKLQWKQEADALVIDYPPSADFPFGVVFRID